ncbi:hypothetical protein FCH83_14700 [Pseudomonas putida]|nr:hypothetical protein [Pseudomonas putida]NTZ02086.1 hypothetical protein [Pseudomonas putida]NTZ24062.1 hypothetical protein [Pseudomonas putida]NTZ56787.1 hypothetical protein [Pseudomonas putida]NTZ67085.1 hypothetical protein [Pseudomonas putida]
MFSALGKSESSRRSIGTAPHIAGLVSSRVNRFSCEHAPAAGKTPVWLKRTLCACQMSQQAPCKAFRQFDVSFMQRRYQTLIINSQVVMKCQVCRHAYSKLAIGVGFYAGNLTPSNLI